MGEACFLLLTQAMLALQIFQHPTRQGPERLESSPIEFLLLTQATRLISRSCSR